MAERKPFLLRLEPRTMRALRAWATDDLRSLNGQIEFLLRRALRDAGRLPSGPADDEESPEDDNRLGAGTAAEARAEGTRREDDL